MKRKFYVLKFSWIASSFFGLLFVPNNNTLRFIDNKNNLNLFSIHQIDSENVVVNIRIQPATALDHNLDPVKLLKSVDDFKDNLTIIFNELLIKIIEFFNNLPSHFYGFLHSSNMELNEHVNSNQFFYDSINEIFQTDQFNYCKSTINNCIEFLSNFSELNLCSNFFNVSDYCVPHSSELNGITIISTFFVAMLTAILLAEGEQEQPAKKKMRLEAVLAPDTILRQETRSARIVNVRVYYTIHSDVFDDDRIKYIKEKKVTMSQCISMTTNYDDRDKFNQIMWSMNFGVVPDYIQTSDPQRPWKPLRGAKINANSTVEIPILKKEGIIFAQDGVPIPIRDGKMIVKIHLFNWNRKARYNIDGQEMRTWEQVNWRSPHPILANEDYSSIATTAPQNKPGVLETISKNNTQNTGSSSDPRAWHNVLNIPKKTGSSSDPRAWHNVLNIPKNTGSSSTRPK